MKAELRVIRLALKPSREGTLGPDSLKRDFRLAVAFCARLLGFPDRRDAQYKSEPTDEKS